MNNMRTLNLIFFAFLTPKGKEYASKYNAAYKSYSITVSGDESGDGQEIYVLYPDGKEWFKLLLFIKIGK
jgi:hypothetical protein